MSTIIGITFSPKNKTEVADVKASAAPVKPAEAEKPATKRSTKK